MSSSLSQVRRERDSQPDVYTSTGPSFNLRPLIPIRSMCTHGKQSHNTNSGLKRRFSVGTLYSVEIGFCPLPTMIWETKVAMAA